MSALNIEKVSGEFEEVVDFVSSRDAILIHTIDEEEAWAINMKTYALDALKREDEADVLMKGLASIPVDDSNRFWLINFTINHADRLIRHGDWQAALNAAFYAEQFPGTPFADMLILKIKICAMSNLGQDEEATALLDKIYLDREHSYASAAEAMLCSGKVGIAEQIIIEALAQELHRAPVIEALQKPQFNLYATASKLPHLHRLIQESSEVRAEFEKVARLIPDEFIPASGISLPD